MRATRKFRWLKSLDRYVGIPLVAALAPLRRGRRKPTDVRRIGVMKTAAIGDLVLASGAIASIRAAFPNADLTVITGMDNAGVVPLLPFDVQQHVIVAPSELPQSLRRIRALDLDILIDFGSWPRFDAMLAALSGARWRIGFRRRGQGRHWAFDEAVEHSPLRHEIDNYKTLIRSLVGDSDARPCLRPPAADESAPGGPYIVFHPWSGGDRGTVKEWPNDRWVGLAERLGAEFGYVITGGPADVARSRALVAALTARGLAAKAVNVSLGATAALLSKAAVVVAVNTGIMHVAAAVDAATVSLEGPVPVRRWGPVGRRVTSVETAFPGCSYLDLGFEYRGRRTDCMLGVSVERVEQAVRDLMCRPVAE